MTSSKGEHGEALVRERRLHDCRPKVVLSKAGTIILSSTGGATIAYFVPSIGLWTGVAIGAVTGLLVANSLPSLVPFLRPRTKQESLSFRKYRRIRRRDRWLFFFFLIWLTGGYVRLKWFLAGPIPESFWIVWLVPAFLCYMLLMIDYVLLDGWRCPKCRSHFGVHSVLERYPHQCRVCGLTITKWGESDGDTAS